MFVREYDLLSFLYLLLQSSISLTYRFYYIVFVCPVTSTNVTIHNLLNDISIWSDKQHTPTHIFVKKIW